MIVPKGGWNLKPGEYFLKKEPILINAFRKTRTIQVVNRGDRSIFVGSHYHFYETDPGLDFDRNLALGMRLNMVPGEAKQFPPGEIQVVELVEIGGNKEVFGFRGYVNGPVPPVQSLSTSGRPFLQNSM